MDPNELLRRMREYARQAEQGDSVRYNERAIRWCFQELDEWLSKGGFLPKDWERK